MLTHTGEHDLLFADMGENFRVFQLHGETVKLTTEMEQLAIGRLVKNQVVKVGKNAYGIQCHFELTPEMFEVWISEDPDLIKLDRNMLRMEFKAIQEDYTKNGQKLFQNFLKIAWF
jgi:GMP synthase (glutamine-hydrolysing)